MVVVLGASRRDCEVLKGLGHNTSARRRTGAGLEGEGRVCGGPDGLAVDTLASSVPGSSEARRRFRRTCSSMWTLRHMTGLGFFLFSVLFCFFKQGIFKLEKTLLRGLCLQSAVPTTDYCRTSDGLRSHSATSSAVPQTFQKSGALCRRREFFPPHL